MFLLLSRSVGPQQKGSHAKRHGGSAGSDRVSETVTHRLTFFCPTRIFELVRAGKFFSPTLAVSRCSALNNPDAEGNVFKAITPPRGELGGRQRTHRRRRRTS